MHAAPEQPGCYRPAHIAAADKPHLVINHLTALRGPLFGGGRTS
jgi:hypothetical protein